MEEKKLKNEIKDILKILDEFKDVVREAEKLCINEDKIEILSVRTTGDHIVKLVVDERKDLEYVK